MSEVLVLLPHSKCDLSSKYTIQIRMYMYVYVTEEEAILSTCVFHHSKFEEVN